ncbi:aquaporin Z [Marixanthomonas spongiae]|uniref:Aquaporin Z n=1 Tax=Marixanthomonas spongiae TaxID=2174845 RepID=A0A2U0I655_9FLAO|nr:aquaporin Z [Marixanthomonas spongiae]PVW16585.1 aquaporin Z [Marixanthomonas spongiae]
MESSKKYFAEALGTFALVLFGCGAATIASVSQSGPEGIGLLGISLAFGFSLMVMVYAIGPISGCHINPAVSIAMMAAKKLSLKETIGYVLSQCTGATLAAAILYVIAIGSDGFVMPEWGLASNGWGDGYLGEYNIISAAITEFVFTFLFLLVIFGTTAKIASPLMAGLAIGISLTLIHMVAIPITGTSVNPARSLGPALFSGGEALRQLWLFILIPIAGGLFAALVRNLFLED